MSDRTARRPAHLVLADGTRFPGFAIGADPGAATAVVGEAVFTTGMTGYQEVLSDPSYCRQIVTMTAPQMGNTGANDEDAETRRPFVAGFVVHDLSLITANYRAQESLAEYLAQHGIQAIEGVDTRSLTRHIRDHGAQMAALGTEAPDLLHDRAKAAAPMNGCNLTDDVTTREPYRWNEGLGEFGLGPPMPPERHVVAIDYGIKRTILRCLVDHGFRVTVVPARMRAADIMALAPDAIFLSNGPGDPAAVTEGIATVRELLGKKPMFGICLGHQILCLALGGTTHKLKFGHRGLNQPVKDLTTGRIEVTTQNHGFVVDMPSLENRCRVTHLHLNDGTVEGMEAPDANAFSVQYHPEASAGPHDARYLFRRFADRVI